MNHVLKRGVIMKKEGLENVINRQCCVCGYATGDPPYSHTYLSKQCIEKYLDGMPMGSIVRIKNTKSYLKLPDKCGGESYTE